jgi:glutamate/tyrosine decarboxylase-like PLP-dependent enzyme
MKKCSPDEISLKSYFLGPQAENAHFLRASFMELLSQYCHWRESLFPEDGPAISFQDQMQPMFLKNQKALQLLMQNLSRDFEQEIPQFSPRYLGHMFSELTLPGLLGHFTALLHNPNNISKESSKVGLRIEAEALQALYSMFRWQTGYGHLTSGGTVANLEALLRMRSRLDSSLWSQAQFLTSAAAHYSWKKNLKILGFPDSTLVEVPLDSKGRLSLRDLENILKSTNAPILGLVSLYGSTERGTVDDIQGINQILKKFAKKKIWHHVDAAYGGFFACAPHKPGSYLGEQTKALKFIDSLTLDPHKLGYVPYGCGAFLCRRQKDYFYSQVDAPYIQFKSAQEAGVQSVEGSRPATGAAATWLTAQTLGFHNKGLGRILDRHLTAKKMFQKKLQRKMKNIIFTEGLDLNILCWTLANPKRKLSEANKIVNHLFERLPQTDLPYYVSKTSLPLSKNEWLKTSLLKKGLKIDSDSCHFIRMTLMNPFLMTKESQTSYMDDFISAARQAAK